MIAPQPVSSGLPVKDRVGEAVGITVSVTVVGGAIETVTVEGARTALGVGSPIVGEGAAVVDDPPPRLQSPISVSAVT
jgi:hypothetical protein